MTCHKKSRQMNGSRLNERTYKYHLLNQMSLVCTKYMSDFLLNPRFDVLDKMFHPSDWKIRRRNDPWCMIPSECIAIHGR